MPNAGSVSCLRRSTFRRISARDRVDQVARWDLRSSCLTGQHPIMRRARVLRGADEYRLLCVRPLLRFTRIRGRLKLMHQIVSQDVREIELSLVVPTFNEKENIVPLVEKIESVL